MTLSELQRLTPTRTQNGSSTILNWGHVLKVIVLPSGEVGQFSAPGLRLKRADVEGLVSALLSESGQKTSLAPDTQIN